MPPTTRCREHAALHFHGFVRNESETVLKGHQKSSLNRQKGYARRHWSTTNRKRPWPLVQSERWCGRMLLLHPAAHFTIHLYSTPPATTSKVARHSGGEASHSTSIIALLIIIAVFFFFALLIVMSLSAVIYSKLLAATPVAKDRTHSWPPSGSVVCSVGHCPHREESGQCPWISWFL